jgi:hypothetical protein
MTHYVVELAIFNFSGASADYAKKSDAVRGYHLPEIRFFKHTKTYQFQRDEG